jgi:hypothetical protein
MWIRISGSAGIADGFSKFLETGCRTIFNDLVNTGDDESFEQILF